MPKQEVEKRTTELNEKYKGKKVKEKETGNEYFVESFYHASSEEGNKKIECLLTVEKNKFNHYTDRIDDVDSFLNDFDIIH